MRASLAQIAEARSRAASGVDYSARHGAICPWCGQRTRIYKTMPWEGSIRVRYHQCENQWCVVAVSKLTVKSIEVDHVTVEGGGR